MLQGRKHEIGFAIEIAIVDRVIKAMHGQIDRRAAHLREADSIHLPKDARRRCSRYQQKDFPDARPTLTHPRDSLRPGVANAAGGSARSRPQGRRSQAPSRERLTNYHFLRPSAAWSRRWRNHPCPCSCSCQDACRRPDPCSRSCPCRSALWCRVCLRDEYAGVDSGSIVLRCLLRGCTNCSAAKKAGDHGGQSERLRGIHQKRDPSMV